MWIRFGARVTVEGGGKEHCAAEFLELTKHHVEPSRPQEPRWEPRRVAQEATAAVVARRVMVAMGLAQNRHLAQGGALVAKDGVNRVEGRA